MTKKRGFAERVRGRMSREVRIAHRKLLWRLGRPYRYTLPECGGFVYVYPEDKVSLFIVDYSFEVPLRRLMCDILRPGMTFMDVGANLGLYSVIAGKRVGASGRVYAFEPSQREWLRARRCIAANHLRNVTLVRAALSDTDGSAKLSVCDASRAGYNTLGTVSHPDALGHDSHIEEVDCFRLDSFMSAQGVAQVDVVKIDVEGAEELVLRGGADLFARENAPLLLCEVSDWTAKGLQSSAQRVLNLLTRYGYLLFSVQRIQDGYALHRCTSSGEIEYEDVVALKAIHRPWFTIPEGIPSAAIKARTVGV